MSTYSVVEFSSRNADGSPIAFIATIAAIDFIASGSALANINLDFTSIGSVGTRFWRSRDVAKRIEKFTYNIIFYSNQPLEHQVPHDGWVILLDNGASLLVLLLGHEPNGILINIVDKHSSLKKS